MRKYTLTILLCLCLVFSLMGCQENIAPATTTPTVPTTEPATVPSTEPAPDPAQLYAASLEALGTDAAIMNLTVTETMTVAGQEFRRESQQILRYWNIGSEDFLAQIDNINDMADFAYAFTEFYTGGKVYMKLGDGRYAGEMTTEDFFTRYPGLQLLDPALYTLTMEEDGKVIRFTDATAVESWIATEDAQVIHAEGTLALDEDGSAQQLDFALAYTYGSATFDTTYSVTYTGAGEAPSLPEDADQYQTVTDIDGMWLLHVAYGNLLQSNQYTARSIDSFQSQAGGMMFNTQYQLDTYNTGNGVDYHIDSSIFAMGSADEYEQETEEYFLDGKYTISIDGGEAQTNGAVSSYVMRESAKTILTNAFPNEQYLTDVHITNLGSLLLVEFTLSEEWSDTIQENLCDYYFGDADILNDLATAYTTNKKECYLALDAYSLLPTASGYLYEGSHTIEGDDYLLFYQLDIAYDMASLSSHDAIYEEPAPDTEPEEKPTPLFYHVTGADGQEMWLFGTIHVGDDRTGYLPQEIYDALSSSVALAVECDTEGFEKQLEEDDALQSQVSGYYYYDDGPITDHLVTEDLYEDAVKVLKATGNYFFNADYQKAGVWSSSIDNYYLDQGHQLVSEKGIESRLEAYAEENGIPLWEVESSLFQIQMLTGYSDMLQEFQLYNSIATHGKENWEGVAELYDLWCAGDEKALTDEMARTVWEFTEEDLDEWEAEGDLTEEDQEVLTYLRENLDSINQELEELYWEYTTAMEIDRNRGMLNKAVEYLESGETVFYAVGLAHLLAEDGLVHTLREAGYTVELVTFELQK